MPLNIEETESNVMNTLKKAKLGTLFQKDTWDLFGSLLLSLKLTTHKHRFRSYPDTFIGQEAVQGLASLKYIRSPNTGDLSQLVPMSVHRASLSHESALSLMQIFVDGSLIKEAITKEHTIYFAPKSIYQLTYKGFVVLEEFIEQNDIQDDADHLVVARSSQPSPRPKLWRLERRPADDELILTQAIVTKLFRRFAGRRPNYGQRELTGVSMVPFGRRNKVLDPHFRKKDSLPLGGKVSGVTSTHCMKAPILIHWLCDHTTISSPREAAEVAAHFVRFGLLVLVSNKDEVAKADTVSTFVVHGPVQRGDPLVTASAEFLYTHGAIYAITDEGNRVAGWRATQTDGWVSGAYTDEGLVELLLTNPQEFQLPLKDQPTDPINATRLKKFVKDPNMLVLFRQFMRDERADYDLAFWIDVEDFITEFDKSSNLPPLPTTPPVAGSSKTPMEPLPASERPHEALSNIPFLIYNTYLAPTSTCKLSFNIGEDLRTALQEHLEASLEYLTNQALTAEAALPGEPKTTLRVDQLAVLVKVYERLQDRVLATLADEYVPKFLKSPKFLATRINAIREEEETPETLDHGDDVVEESR